MTHYFSPEPTVASRPGSVRLSLVDLNLELATDRGMFSPDAVDEGTRVLLSEVPTPPAGDVTLADIGCGYGPVALALASRSPDATVWAVDVNERALACARQNAQTAGVADRIRLVTPSEVPDDLRLDGFWSNPPIRIGKRALHELLTFWLGRLRPGATAHLVVHKHLGADSLTRWIDDAGYEVARLVSRRGYRILACTRTNDEVPT